MKRCSACKTLKPITEFNKNNSKRDGLQNACKHCHQASAAKYYKNNREKHLKLVNARNRRIYATSRAYMIHWLERHPCVDCGEDDIVVLDFDHVRGIKCHNISSMVRQAWSLKTIENEIAKCEIRCANCHRRKTAKQFGWAKLASQTRS